MQPCGARFANALEDALHQLELVRRKGIHLGKVILVTIGTEGPPGAHEAQLVAEDVCLTRVELGQLVMDGFGLGQQAGLNDLIDIGAGK